MTDNNTARFEEAFGAFKEKRILLYGTGQNAKAIVERFDDTYRLIGLLTFGRAQSILYGKHTFGMEDIEGLAPDLIVLADPDSASQKLLTYPGNIPVYDLNGKQLNQASNDEKLAAYDVVSFSVNSLLSRELTEEQLFTEIQKEALAKGLKCPADFPQKRQTAARRQHYLTLDTIYDGIRTEAALSVPEAEALKETELELTGKYMKTDPKLKELYQRALALHKTIVLVVDSHLDQKQLGTILREKGIMGYEKIFSSCEYQKYKKTGLLAEARKAYPAKKIIHLGCDQESDGISARKSGLDAWVLS